MLLMTFAVSAGMIKLQGIGTVGELRAVEFMAFFSVYNLFIYLTAFMYSSVSVGGAGPIRYQRAAATAPDVREEIEEELFFDDE